MKWLNKVTDVLYSYTEARTRVLVIASVTVPNGEKHNL